MLESMLVTEAGQNNDKKMSNMAFEMMKSVECNNDWVQPSPIDFDQSLSAQSNQRQKPSTRETTDQ